ncbi:MAG: hypothetical protein LBH60_06210 [Prevotellaceae bacterium]|jgi:hypothetical protein|nr:hypothetical protein [Prevotellaceae bacterium]
MVTKTVAIDTFFDDLLKSVNYQEEKTVSKRPHNPCMEYLVSSQRIFSD